MQFRSVVGLVVDLETAHQPRRQHRLRQHYSRRYNMKQLVCCLILSIIDYCNSILIGIPVSSTALLQRLQNEAVRLVMGLRARDHVTSALASIRELPIHYRIQYKVMLTMFFIHNIQCTAYLSHIIIPHHDNPER